MKYTPLLTVLVAAVLALGLTACSPDIEEEVEEETTFLPFEPIEPDWADGVLTITVGNYQTGVQILRELERRNVGLGISIDNHLLDPNFPISHKQYTIEVAVIRMFDIGFDEPATYAEVYDRFKNLGYRPLTSEEAMELRLQFSNQPEMGSGELMSKFFVLIDLSVIKSFGLIYERYYVIGNGGDSNGVGGIGTRSRGTDSGNFPLLNPATDGILLYDPRGSLPEVRFAVVKE